MHHVDLEWRQSGDDGPWRWRYKCQCGKASEWVHQKTGPVPHSKAQAMWAMRHLKERAS